MTLALASRGYLCRGRGGGGGGVYGPGPRIIGSDEIAPGIDGAALMQKPAPTITGAGVQGPRITKSVRPTPPPAGPTPVITGAGDMKPAGTGKGK